MDQRGEQDGQVRKSGRDELLGPEEMGKEGEWKEEKQNRERAQHPV